MVMSIPGSLRLAWSNGQGAWQAGLPPARTYRLDDIDESVILRRRLRLAGYLNASSPLAIRKTNKHNKMPEAPISGSFVNNEFRSMTAPLHARWLPHPSSL